MRVHGVHGQGASGWATRPSVHNRHHAVLLVLVLLVLVLLHVAHMGGVGWLQLGRGHVASWSTGTSRGHNKALRHGVVGHGGNHAGGQSLGP